MKPNIIYILADDMGYGDVSYFNEDSKIVTNNLDNMAKEGMAFTSAYSSSAVCTPSRYGILTGRYNWRSKLKSDVLWGYSTHLIEDGRKTVASMLKEDGYKTACIGKWHLGLDWYKNGEGEKDVDFSKPIKNGPRDFGFDYFYGISGSLDMDPYVYIENDRVTSLPNRLTKNESSMGWWREGPTGEDFKHEEVLGNLTNKVIDTIDKFKEEPFFIYFPMTAPHTPILPTKEYLGKSGTNTYGDFVLMCDDVVGKIIQKLKEENLDENTIVVFASDNGCSPSADFKYLSKCGHNPSFVFRGHKADIYEGGHRIPLIVRWPNEINNGIITDEPVSLVDLMATVAEINGIKLPDNVGEDSVSNLPVWLSKEYKKPLREAVVQHSINGSFSIRKGKWKLEMCPGSGGWSYPMPGKEGEDAPPIQLYDLENDIGEKVNIYDKHPEVVEELKSLLTKYIKEGRSTKGVPQKNTGGDYWKELSWI